MTEQKAELSVFYKTKPDARNIELFKPLVEDWKRRHGRTAKRKPYVLLGAVARELGQDNEGWRLQLHHLPCGLMHSSADDLQRYLNRGFVILDSYFPPDNFTPRSRQVANNLRLLSGWQLEWNSEEGRSRAAALKSLIKQHQFGHQELQDAKRQAQDYKAKYEAMLDEVNKGKPQQTGMGDKRSGK